MYMKNLNYDGGTPPFNMSAKYMEHLADIRKKITEVRFSNNLIGWYRLCQDFYDLCALMFSAEENADVEKRLTEVKNNLNVPQTREGHQLAQLKIPTVEGKLSELTRLLYHYLNEHERIFRKNKFETHQEELEADY